MSENNEFTLEADNGQESANTSVNTPAIEPEVNAANDGSEAKGNDVAQHTHEDKTGSFKARLDRMKAREQAKYEQKLKERDEAWEKRFKDLENSLKQPKGIKREDFASDEEFINARKKDAMDKLFAEFDSRNKAKADAEAEETRKHNEIIEGYKKFATKFHERMQQTMTPEEQQRVIAIANDRNSAINLAMSSNEGKTLQSWLMEDCENPAKIIDYLESHEDQMETLMTLSPRRQVQQLDILERHLANSRKANPNANVEPPKSKPVVMGAFGGSTQPVGDESQKGDAERVADLIKAMRKR